jgi:hypothetical protein
MCLVVQMRTPDGTARTAVVRDASEGGAFLLTRGPTVREGEDVELEVVPVTEGHAPAKVRGRVLRLRPWEQSDLWRVGVAVRFEGGLPASLLLAEISARYASWSREPT